MDAGATFPLLNIGRSRNSDEGSNPAAPGSYSWNGLGPLKTFALIVVAMAFSSSAPAAGVDSRAYTCAGLHALVAANRYVFINYPSFMDFVVANASVCSSGELLQLRSVPTSDTPECIVNYCRSRGGGGGSN
jgi:hypothetical protein